MLSPVEGPASPRLPGASSVITVVLGVLVLLAGCGSEHTRSPEAGIPRALLSEARPIGHGPRFAPPADGPVIGRCARRVGPRYGVHVEVFAADRVVLIPAGIGTRAPRRFSAGRISAAACFGDLVTLEPTGVVLIRPGARLFTADVFRAWGQPLSSRAITFVSSAARGAGGCVCRGATLAGAAGPRSPGEACGDRLRGRAVRPATLAVHIPAGHLMSAADRRVVA